MVRAPQPPVPHFFEQPPAPAPAGLLVALAAAALLVVSMFGALVKGLASRWRGIVVAHLFFLTLWMAVQVFFFATGAYWCLPSDSSTTAEWFSRYFTHIARCAPQTLPVSQATAPEATAPAPVPPRPPVTVPAPATPRAPAAPPQAAPPPPAVGAPLPPASGYVAPWSGRTVQNCWRNRSVESEDCYGNLYRRPAPEPPLPPPPPPVVRHRYYPAPPYSCRGAYDCWPDEYWLYDYDARY